MESHTQANLDKTYSSKPLLSNNVCIPNAQILSLCHLSPCLQRKTLMRGTKKPSHQLLVRQIVGLQMAQQTKGGGWQIPMREVQ